MQGVVPAPAHYISVNRRGGDAPGAHRLQPRRKDVSTRLAGPAFLVSSGILLSRVAGLVRDIVFAYFWGTGMAFAAFRIAFAVPNLLRALFGEGAFSAAFVPSFSERLEHQGKAAAWALAQRVITALGAALVALVVLAGLGSMAAAPFLENALARLTLRLIPRVMPYALLICFVAAFSGVLNSLRRFTVPALAPVVLNLVFIFATLLVCPYWGR